MKLKAWIILATLILILPCFLIAEEAQSPANLAKTTASISKLPLSFESVDTGRFLAHSGNYAVMVGPTDSYIALTQQSPGQANIIRYSFDQSNKSAVVEGIDRLPGVLNYYRGRDSRDWKLSVPTFARLRARSIYPGIDVIYYGDQRRLEFDFVVAPKSDPGVIAIAITGADKISISPEGGLVAEVGARKLLFAKPQAYQRFGEVRKSINVEYVLDPQGRARMSLGDYDVQRELVIDPVLTYSSFLGGSQADTANGIAVDNTGNSYVTGQTCSSNFIVATPNPSGTGFAGTLGACDAYITKLDTTGTNVVYTTFIAGQLPNPPNATASGNGIAVDPSGRAYIVGTTNFWDLPLTTPNPVNRASAYNGGDSDVFITILNPDGTLLRETYLGGKNIDQGYGIVVDSQLNVSAVGQTCSSDFPAYNSLQAKVEPCVAFVTKLDFGLHIASPVLPGASPLSPRAPSLADACSYGTNCPATPDATKIYYFFSTLFGGQPVPPEATWPSLNAPNYLPGLQVPVGAITIATPQCGTGSGDKPQVLLAEPAADPRIAGTSVKLDWPCGSVEMKAGIPDEGGFVWYDLGNAPAAITYATTEAYGVALDPVGDVFAVGGTNTADLTPYLFYGGYRGINYGKTGPWAIKLGGLHGDQIYATALGTAPTENPGQRINAANGIAVDSSGDAYIVGTASAGVLTTTGTASATSNGGQDAFVIKLNKPASAFDYGTYLGGKGDDQGLAIAIDTGGSAYITGSTKSNDLPVTNAITDSLGNPEAALLGPQDAFIARITPTGSSVTMMSYLGGASSEQANAIALDKNGAGDIYIAGTSQSVDFPTTSGVAQSLYAGGTTDSFVALINGTSFPKASVTPSGLAFGTQNVGTPSTTKTVALQNTGSGILSISSIAMVGSTGDYSQSNDCGAQLSPAGGAKDHCTITVAFTPTAMGSRSDVLQIVDNSANTPQIVALSGTGVVVQGVLQLSPTSLAFGNQQTGSASAAQTITLTNTSTSYALTISNLSIGGDFKQTNNCPMNPATLAPNSNCTIQVTFAPVSEGAQSVNLTVSGTAANSPQSVTLTGTGVAPGSSGSSDFSLKSSSNSITASSAGGTAAFNVFATPLNGFKETLTFSCSLPAGASCSVSPGTLLMDGTSIPSVAVTVSISSGGAPPVRTGDNRQAPRAIFASILPFCVIGMTFAGRKRRILTLLLILLVGLLLLSTSCGVSKDNNSNANRMTPGVYQVSVTASSTGTSAISHTVTIPMTVN